VVCALTAATHSSLSASAVATVGLLVLFKILKFESFFVPFFVLRLCRGIFTLGEEGLGRERLYLRLRSYSIELAEYIAGFKMEVIRLTY